MTFHYHRPHTLAEALRLKREVADARFLAGGTDLLVESGCGTVCPSTVISLRAIPGLAGIRDGGTRIGALTVIADLTAHPFPVIAQAARRIGCAQIRNVATVGGNLCRAAPCADTAPPLLVHEARVLLRRLDGVREVGIEDFFRGPGETCLAPGEMLEEIRLDPPPPGARGRFLKKGRVRMDLSLASVAVLLQAEGARCLRVRIAAGAVAPVPLRLTEVEALLEGRTLTPARLAEAQALASATVAPISDVRTHEAYRRHITGVYVRRALEELLA